jgi:dolichol-phosphate mannosyltransferase
VSTVVVIPTYQEAPNVAEIIARTRAAVPDADILIVDDSSADGTADIAERIGREIGGVGVLRRPRRSGLGPAYREGMARALDAGYDVLVSMDADGSHDPGTLPRLLEAIDRGADVAMGSRYIAGGSVPGWAAHRRLLSRGGNLYAGALLGMAVHDATGGFRAYRAEVLRKLDLSTLGANGYGFQIELCHRVTRLGVRVVEVPIAFTDRRLGTSKMSATIIWEALGLVTWWAIRDKLRRYR